MSDQESSAEQENIRLNQELEIAIPAKMRTFPVKRNQWGRLRTKIARCRWQADWWEMATSALFAIGLFGVGLGLTAPSGDDAPSTFTLVAYWGSGAIGLVGGLICFFARKSLGSRQQTDIQDALEYMGEMEEDIPP